MYTSGIRKIFTPNRSMNVEEIQRIATDAGYAAYSLNGDIYVAHNDAWILSPFRLIDFTTGL